MANHAPHSVVLTYDEVERKFNVQTLSPAKLAPLLAGRLEMPILLEEFSCRIDDELVRRLGVAMLNLIALGKPELKQYMSHAGADFAARRQRLAESSGWY